MGDINLYQYSISPFSEKLRRVLVYKGLKWNPIDCHYEDKTNLLKITGGKWTRVPVVEWNGEVVWNSTDIIKWIDQKVPARRVIPEGVLGLCEVIDQWADNTLFTPILLLVIPDLLDAAGDAQLRANREKLIGMSSAQMRCGAAAYREQLVAFARMIDTQLEGKDFFLGGGFTMADASLYHPFFFLALNLGNFEVVREFKNLARWYERVRDLK
ncbi:MAG TPA: glutathione S-transferase family protein [Candidatus Binataceae bacterium]|nr:glutathione S-transferase family protein [Candidatus Binataceae bacterium]